MLQKVYVKYFLSDLGIPCPSCPVTTWPCLEILAYKCRDNQKDFPVFFSSLSFSSHSDLMFIPVKELNTLI